MERKIRQSLHKRNQITFNCPDLLFFVIISCILLKEITFYSLESNVYYFSLKVFGIINHNDVNIIHACK